MTDHREGEIIEQVKAGEVNAFEELVRKYERPLLVLARNFLGRTPGAEDLVQDVFLAAYLNIGSYHPAKGGFATWLFRIARNKCLNWVKKKREIAMEEPPEPVARDNPETDLIVKEAFARLDRALEDLPARDKMIFILAEFQGLSLEEIATVEGMNVGAVKSRLFRVRKRVRATLEDSAS